VVTRACEAGVERILTVGEDLATSRRAVEIASQFECVYAAVGVHPHRADRFRDERHDVEELLAEDKVVAIGEIGLDAVRSNVATSVQMDAFREQLRWALERAIPVSVHNRGADSQILRALRLSPATAVLHCFDSTAEFADEAVRSGHFVSFAGNLTFKNSSALRAVAPRVPDDRYLVETDSPVLAPQSRRGRRNEPANVVETVEVLASLRGVSVESASAQISANADRVFHWSSQ
jgi:TatD DNase family protein